MDRRAFLTVTSLGSAVGVLSKAVSAAEFYSPTKVDPTLFETINRAKDVAHKTPLESSHAPVLTCPETVTSGSPFWVEVSVGEKLHPMGPSHWIEFVELNVGNEPAGSAQLQPRGFLSPKVTFQVVLSREMAPSGKVTLVARQRCNLHGYWEGVKEVSISS